MVSKREGVLKIRMALLGANGDGSEVGSIIPACLKSVLDLFALSLAQK